MAHQIVVIGASFAGLTVTANLLKTILPPLTQGGKQSFKVTLVNPSEDFFWKIGAPRTIVNPASLPLEKTLLPIAPAFKDYSAEQFEFIIAYASSIDANSKAVKLSTGQSVSYDTLVICSGTHFSTDIWSTTPGSAALKAALKEIHEKLPSAKSVLVAGGGPAGVETAGELGEVYGNKKELTILSGTTNLLNSLNNKNVGKDAEGRLTKMGVKVIHGVQVTSHHAEGGKEVLQLSNGETQTVDVYIEAVGDKPNSSFVPQEWLTEKNQVKTDPQTLRLDVPGVTGVYCYGTVASYSNGSIADVMFAKKAILETLRSDLSGTGKSISSVLATAF
jgi:apoptosis-inducing factor 2